MDLTDVTIARSAEQLLPDATGIAELRFVPERPTSIEQGACMGYQRRMRLAGSVMAFAGACLLVLVGGLYAYGRLEAWVEAQPLALVSQELVWPEMPPMTALPSPTPIPTSTPTPTPTPGPPARVEIPRLRVERAIVPVGKVTRSGRSEWDTESLFATSNRPDLVGHLEGTANPGQIGNVVLAGHNYNRGIHGWAGVFQSLQRLEQGDVIRVSNDRNDLFTYRVERVDKVPWRAYSGAQSWAHMVYLLPTADETLTLVTCGGANFAPFPSRVYIVAKRSIETTD